VRSQFSNKCIEWVGKLPDSDRTPHYNLCDRSNEQLEEAIEGGTEQPLVEAEEPIFGLGTHPIDCGLVDAAENHDRYLYTGL
jgi:hypothetical protein